MKFKRKAYDYLKKWKKEYADQYAILIEGARRVGKSTIAEEFARNEYRSYILIDFSNVPIDILNCFNDITRLDTFFLRLQAVTGISLYVHESVIVFDEIQFFPKARQAIKHLVKDGRYHYIETGSLISIKKNVKDILIPSEEKKMTVFPMDYEEFLWACGKNTFDLTRQIYKSGESAGRQINQNLMRDLRIYMAVGGMPQAVDAYVTGKNFSQIDEVKRSIISLYEDDFYKIDNTGRMAAMYHSIPSQLSRNVKRYRITSATGKKLTNKDDERLFDLLDSKTVEIAYNVLDPSLSLSMTKDLDSYKLYLADTGLFVTLMFIDRPVTENEIYAKLLADKLPSNLGYLYENMVAQMIASTNRKLLYHTWEKNGSTHHYEIDFLIPHTNRITPIEVKSSGTGKHASITEFVRKYKDVAGKPYIIFQRDVKSEENINFLPVYMFPYLLE